MTNDEYLINPWGHAQDAVITMTLEERMTLITNSYNKGVHDNRGYKAAYELERDKKIEKLNAEMYTISLKKERAIGNKYRIITLRRYKKLISIGLNSLNIDVNDPHYPQELRSIYSD